MGARLVEAVGHDIHVSGCVGCDVHWIRRGEHAVGSRPKRQRPTLAVEFADVADPVIAQGTTLGHVHIGGSVDGDGQQRTDEARLRAVSAGERSLGRVAGKGRDASVRRTLAHTEAVHEVDIACSIEGQRLRPAQPGCRRVAVDDGGLPRNARDGRHHAGAGNLAQRAVAGVRDQHVAGCIDGDTPGTSEPGAGPGSVRRAGLPGCAGERGHAAIGGNFPDRVVTGVGHIDVAGSVLRHVRRPVELRSRAGSVAVATGLQRTGEQRHRGAGRHGCIATAPARHHRGARQGCTDARQ